jgi:RNA polymerase sigma-70 factor (ECF subfamily)
MFSQNSLVAETVKLQRFALRLTRNKADADDLVQSTCLRALEKADCFQDGSNLFSWTSKIMYNLFVSDYRRKVKFESPYDPEPYLEKQSVKPSQDINMEFADVQRAMLQLNTDQQEILTLTCIEGRSYQETSERLHIPLGTVRSRLSRAREQLQSIMSAPPRRITNENRPFVPAYIAADKLRKAG